MTIGLFLTSKFSFKSISSGNMAVLEVSKVFESLPFSMY